MNTNFKGKSGMAQRLAVLLCLTGLLSFTAANARADQDDPPSRVARMSEIDGSVSLQAGGEGDWGTVTRNRPVTVGDKLWSDKGSRAELQAGQASIHLGGMTALSFLNLDQNITQMRLAEGSVNFRVRELREGDLYEVDTPNTAFTVREAGSFRVDVNENGDGTMITVIRGEGEVTAGGQTYTVRGGETAEFNGTDDNVNYNSRRAQGSDDLDRWADERDNREEHSISSRYVSRDTVGYSDLDDYGTWDDTPDYGHVWYPSTVSVGWAPYSDGNWSYVAPWGWTWVGYEPWGFAPYHYGRWNYFGNRWGWCPGPIGGYPGYGPAFVGFLGGGIGFGASFGFGYGGGVGWFPLGYGEVYLPWYHHSGDYIRNVNINNTRITNINNINNTTINNYNYAHNPAAVTAASRNTFVNGQAVNRNAVHLTAASLRGAQVGAPTNLTPTRQSYLGAAARSGRVATPPSALQNRTVVSRTAPAAAAANAPVRTLGGNNGAGLNRGNMQSNRGAGTVNNGASNRPNTVTGPGAVNRGNVPTNGSTVTPRQRQLSSNRPPSAATGNAGGTYSNGGSAQRPNSAIRNYPGQGSSQRPQPGSANNSAQGASRARSDRPAWAGSGSNPSTRSEAARGSSSAPVNRSYPAQSQQNYPAQQRPSNTSRSYPSQDRPSASQAPRQNSAPSRQNSAPSRPSNAQPNRGESSRPSASPNHSNYSAPTRPNSAPQNYPAQRAYSAPSRNYSAPQQRAPQQQQQRAYSAPPQRQYSAPPQQRQYSAPPQQRAYSAPAPQQRAYSAPQQSRGNAAPPQRSAPSNNGGARNNSGGNNGGGRNPHGR